MLSNGPFDKTTESIRFFIRIGLDDESEAVMSSPTMRRAERMMPDDSTFETLVGGYSGRLATIGIDGYPYCIPLLYVWMDGELYFHTTSAKGHLRTNINANPRVCFEMNQAEGVFDYGRFECDSGLAYRSVVVFGMIRVIEERERKQQFCEQLMAKYGKPETIRPKGFFPLINIITVYALSIERMTGKQQALPPLSEQWPNLDMTKTPNARPS
jgi:nitroimidazol reductase NimA-like FMN-containing flavoprotein (pyridoxamine 5'-phosphate oxidase superfamily)